MANNYYDMTGVLVLDAVTPVIKALFGRLHLDAKSPGNGQAFIADIAESTNCTWNSVLVNLQALVKELGVSLSDDAESNVQEHLYALATHFGADQDAVLFSLVEHLDFDCTPNLDALFEIAIRFDDGHGLKSYKTEASWHCSQPRLFQFGGAGEFRSRLVTLGNSSGQTVLLGEDLDKALLANDIETCASRIFSEVQKMIDSIKDETQRTLVLAQLADLVAH